MTALWIDAKGKTVCETIECAGGDLLSKILAYGSPNEVVTDKGETFARLNEASTAELGNLLALTGHWTLACGCGSVVWNDREQRLVRTERV